MIIKETKITEEKEDKRDNNISNGEEEKSKSYHDTDSSQSESSQQADTEDQLKDDFNNYVIVHSSNENYISSSNLCIKVKDFAITIMHLIFDDKRDNFKFLFIDDESQKFLQDNRWFIDKIASCIIESSSEAVMNANVIQPETIEYREYDNSFDEQTLGGNDA